MLERPSTAVPRAVFLSYASQDRNAARRICESLRSGGVEVWFDQEGGLEHGDEWDAKIRRQIKECLFFIPLISANTQARLEGYFRIEWDLAAERAQGIAHGVPFLLPAVIDGTSEAEALVPERFCRVQWMRLPEGYMSPEVLARLLRLWTMRAEPAGRTGVRAQPLAMKPVAPPPRSPAQSRLAEPSPAAQPGPGAFARTAPPPEIAAEPGAPRGQSRFGNLEFGDIRPPAAKAEVVKDEAYYVAQADECFLSGRFELALRAYSKVVECNVANHDAWTSQVRMLVEMEEYREARLWADKALERFTTYPDLLAAKAVVLARTGDLDSALAFSDGAVEERGNTPYVWLARGDVLLARGEAKAAYCFDQVMTLSRGSWQQYWLASRIHDFHGSYARALQFAQQAVDLAPGRAVAWLQLARCHVALGFAGRAEQALTQARQLDAGCPGLDQVQLEAQQITGRAGLWRRVRRLFK